MAAKQKKPTAPKITKKQVGNLDKAESRKLAVFGMGLDMKRSFGMSPAELITWIVDNQHLLPDVDLASCDQDRLFRPGVADYLLEVQRYLRGERDNPQWHEDATPDPPTDEEVAVGRPNDSRPPVDLDDNDEEEPAEVVEFPDHPDTEPEPAQEENPMPPKESGPKPAMRNASTVAPTTFLRRTAAPAAVVAPTPEPVREMARPTEPAPSGLSAEEVHALIEMVGQVAERSADLPAQLAALREQIDARADDLKSRVDVHALTKKVDTLTAQMREIAATQAYQSNALALLVNFWRPMGTYAHLSDVPDPSTYIDEIDEAVG